MKVMDLKAVFSNSDFLPNKEEAPPREKLFSKLQPNIR